MKIKICVSAKTEKNMRDMLGHKPVNEFID